MATTENASETEIVEDEQPNPKPPVTKPAPKAPTLPRDEEMPEDPETLKDELKRARDAIKKNNKENADRRRRIDELEQAETARQTATMGESERLKKEAKDAAVKAAEAERRAVAAEEAVVKVKINAEVERQAAKMGWEYPDIAPSLIDPTRVEIDDDGKIIGVKEALDRVVKERPGLVLASPRGGSPPREGPRRKPDGSRETTEETSESYLRGTGKYSF